jgi:hypothetical protein
MDLAAYDEPEVEDVLIHVGPLYATTGQHEQARAKLSTAIELYRGMEMQFWLPLAEATLAQVRGMRFLRGDTDDT